MSVRDIAVFLVIQAAMVFLALIEAYQEDETGWKHNKHWFSIRLPMGTQIHAYHVFMFAGLLPIFIFVLPFVLVGWDGHLFLVLLFSYIFGITLEDFLWFVVNPHFGLGKWNKKHVTWYSWVQVAKNTWFPKRYIFSLFSCLVLLPAIFALQ